MAGAIPCIEWLPFQSFRFVIYWDYLVIANESMHQKDANFSTLGLEKVAPIVV